MDFWGFLRQHDIILLTETRRTNTDESWFPSHTVHHFPSPGHYRPAGYGVLVAVRRDPLYHAQLLTMSATTVWVKLHFVGRPRPLVVACCYVPCASSARLQLCDVTTHFMALEDAVSRYGDSADVVIAGDFNAKVGSLSDCEAFDGVLPRGCTLPETNEHGVALTDLCRTMDLLLCTGRVPGDGGADPSYRGPRGALSRLDHIAVSTAIFSHITHSHVDASRSDSDHFPVICHLELPALAPAPAPPAEALPLRGVGWDARRQGLFVHHLQNGPLGPVLARGGTCNETPLTFDMLHESVWAAACQAGMPLRSGGTSCGRGLPGRRPRLPFFDQDCRVAYRLYQAETADQTLRRAHYRAFQALLARKRREYARQQIIAVSELRLACPAAFWQKFRARTSPLPQALSTVGAWQQYIEGVACMPSPSMGPELCFPTLAYPLHPPSSHWALHDAFTSEEVHVALQGIPRHKSGGLAGTPCELYQNAWGPGLGEDAPPRHILLPALTQLYNEAFSGGGFPASRNCALITPVYKRGPPLEPANYRPIAVTEPVARLYAKLLNKRITTYLEEAELRSPTQAGFRPGYRTDHQIFALSHFLLTARAARAPLFACFLDLKGAYDHVRRDYLWVAMERCGLGPKVVSAVQALYASASVAIKAQGCRGVGLPSTTGLRQGCPLSPTLFGVFMDGLDRHLASVCADAGWPVPGHAPVVSLGYADDFVLLSPTEQGLQALINATVGFCDHTGMVVSPEKSKVIVFGPSAPDGVWPCGAASGAPEIPQVKEVTYLGVGFSTPYSLNTTFAALERRLHSASAFIRQQIGSLDCMPSLDHMFAVFEACIPAKLCTGCAVWGPLRLGIVTKAPRQKLALLYLRYVKHLLGVRKTAPTDLVWMEVPVRPLPHTWLLHAVSFFNSLCEAPPGSLYRLLLAQSCANTSDRFPSWARCLAQALQAAGHPMPNGPVPLEPLSVSAVQTCLRRQVAAPVLGGAGTRVRTYRQECLRPSEAYRRRVVGLRLPAKHVRALLRFRLGCHGLPVDSLVQQRGPLIPHSQRLCPHCPTESVGDEHHFIFHCHALNALRASYAALFLGPHTVKSFLWQSDLPSVAMFISRGLKLLASLSSS